MSGRIRLFTKRALIIANAVEVFIFLLSCAVPHLHPRYTGFLGFLGLGFPYLLLLNLVFLVWWLVILRPHYALISGIALVLAVPNLLVSFAFHRPVPFDRKRAPGTLRVVTWNVARFLELKRNTNEKSRKRLEMIELIRRQDADVLCLQEFHTSTNGDYYDNIEPIRALGYPFYYFSYDRDGDNHYYSSIIFSRIPFVDTGRARYPRPTLADVLMYADLRFAGDTIRIYNTHLQSNQFGIKDYERIGRITNGSDSLVANSRSILRKVKRAFLLRSIQADMAHELMGNAPHPRILCADLNDVPTSYTYFTMRGRMQDAFLKKGSGIGRTFSGLAPTLRIDYIFADPRFRVRQFGRVVRGLSDHYLLVADLELLKKP